MAQWVTVAEGVSFNELELLVADMELPKGTKMRVVMDTWADWLFDVAGAELVFQPFIPDGMDLIDVYGENGQGIVDMEADPAWLVAVWAFIKLHWVAIAIGLFILGLIVSFIRVMIKLPAAAQIPVALLIGVAIGVVGLTILATRTPRAPPT